MGKTTLFAFVFILAVTFTACDDFFSSGWGTPRDYQAEHINVTVDSLDRWLDRTVGNPPLARQVNAAILKQLTNPSLSPAERAKFQRAGVRIAVESSNLGISLFTNALGTLADLADRIDSMDAAQMERLMVDILGGIQSDFKKSGGASAAQDIVTFAKMAIDHSKAAMPQFSSGSYFATEASPSEVAKAILVLTLAGAENTGLDISKLDGFDLETLDLGIAVAPEGGVMLSGEDADDNAFILAAYLNLVIEENRFSESFFTSFIKDAFVGSAGSV